MTEAAAAAIIGGAPPEAAAVGDSEALLTLADLARHLRASSTRTARRALAEAMENDPGLYVTKRGRTILFTEAQFARTVKALEWSPPRMARAVRSASVARTGRTARPAQDVVRELTQKRPRPGAKQS